MDTGWIKIYRKMLDNPIVNKDPDHIAVWMYLLLNASHNEYKTMFGGKSVMLKPGQLVTGRKKISEKVHVNEYKVMRVLKLFESEQQIAQQTERYGTLITILSWSEYQESAQQNEQQVHNNCTTTAQQLHTKQECKELKNVKKSIRFTPPTLEEVRDYCRERNNAVDPERFVDYYQSNGWKVGKHSMKDWKAAVRTWEKNERKKAPQQDDWMQRWNT